MKGLCPFHDEKSPSFHVTPARGFYHCFGCQESGDVISFLMKIDGLAFTETVERLADKYGVTLRREDGDVREDRPRGPQRGRLVEANKVAQAYYADQLAIAGGGGRARQFLGERGFDQAAAEQFGIGFAPRDGEALVRHLRQKGFKRRGGRRGGARRAGAVGVRPVPRPAAVADPRRQRRHHRVRGAPDLRRRQDRGQVPQHLRDPALQEEPGALRHRPGPPRHGPHLPGRRRRGLHRRDGLPPLRACRPPWRPAARRSATTTPGCCGGSCTTTRSSAAR